MATKHLYNLSLDGVFLPLCLPLVGLTYMGAPEDLPIPNKRSVVNGKVRNVVGYNHRLYAELATNEIQLTQEEIAIQVINDGILFKQNDRIRILSFPGTARGDICVFSGKILTHLNVGQWHHLRASTTKRILILPTGKTSVYFPFDTKWSLQMDALTPSKT